MNKYILLTEKEISLIEDNNLEEELNKEEIAQLVYSKGFYDKEFFAMYFLEEWVSKPFGRHQTEILDILDKEIDTNIIIARGHGKTTTLLIDIIHSLLYIKYKQQLYIASKKLGEETIGKIQEQLLTNLKIVKVFGNLIPRQDGESKNKYGNKKFRQKQIELINGTSLELITPGESIRGKRPQRIIVDDIDNEPPTPSAGKKQKQWFLGSLYNTLLPGGFVITLGTMVGNLCLVNELKNEGWKTIEYKAIENGKPLWEDMWSLKSLKERKEKIGSLMFNQEYMNIPINSEDTIIKMEMIKYFSYKKDKLKFDFIYMGLDPAISTKEKADDFGIGITGYYRGNKYVIKSRGLKGAEKTKINRMKFIKQYYEQFDVDKIFIENNGFQDLLKDDFQGAGMNITGITTTKDKITNLLRWQGEFETGKVFFNEDDNMTEDLVNQLTQFPDVPHDDLVDGMMRSFRKIRKKRKNKVRVGVA